MICVVGKVAVGKSTYARQLCHDLPAVLFSTDDLMRGIFGDDSGGTTNWGRYLNQVNNLLLNQAVEAHSCGINVVLESGFWTAAHRRYVREFFTAHAIRAEWHYLDIQDEEWQRRIASRDRNYGEGQYFHVGQSGIDSCLRYWEPPQPDEVDVRITS